MSTTIQLRRATAAVAATNNVTLAQGEVGVETDTGKFKIGDGATAWNELTYATDLSRLPSAVLDTTGSEQGQVPVANGAGGYVWAPNTVDNDGFVGSTLADSAIVQSANTEYYIESGQLVMTACQVRAFATRLIFEVDSAGSDLTAGGNLLGVYDVGGKLVMNVGDMTSIYENTPEWTPVVVDLPSSLTPGLYYVAQLMNGTYTASNAPYLTGWRAPMVGELGTKVITPPRVCYGSSSYSSLPTSVAWDADGFSTNTWDFVTFFAFAP